MYQAVQPAFAPWAIVEIPGEYDALTRRRLIEAAYRSSARGVVGLVLRGVSRQAVDTLLNDVVSTRTGDLKGVVYLDAEDEVLAAAARARVVVAATARFRTQLFEHGIAALDVREAAFFLGAGAGVAQLPTPSAV